MKEDILCLTCMEKFTIDDVDYIFCKEKEVKPLCPVCGTEVEI